MTFDQFATYVGYMTLFFIVAETVLWYANQVKRLIAHIKAKTDTPSVVVYLDGVPIGTMEVGE